MKRINVEEVYGQKIGLSKEEFLKEYMHVFTRDLPIAVAYLSDRQKALLRKEERYAEYIYEDFVDSFGYGVPIDLVEGMGIRSFQERKHLYALKPGNKMSAEHFVYLFLDFLESKSWLTIRKFGEEYYQEIRKLVVHEVQMKFELADNDFDFP